MIKKAYIFLSAALFVLFFCSCAKQDAALQKMESQKSSDGNYMTIIWDKRTYVPYTSISKSEMGKKIGYYIDESDTAADGEDSAVYVYEYKGYSSAEWLADYAEGFMNTPALWREVNVTKIPGGLSSDYDWNK